MPLSESPPVTGTPNFADSPSLAAAKSRISVIETAIVPDGIGGVAGIGQTGGVKHQRLSTGVVTAGARVAVTVTWTVPFADANYTAMANVFDATSAAQAAFLCERIMAQDRFGVTVIVRNSNASNLTGIVYVIAMHD